MARYLNIYAVYDHTGDVTGCFTIKHEMVTWLDRHRDEVGFADWSVWRYPDNPGFGPAKRGPTLMPIEELLA